MKWITCEVISASTSDATVNLQEMRIIATPHKARVLRHELEQALGRTGAVASVHSEDRVEVGDAVLVDVPHLQAHDLVEDILAQIQIELDALVGDQPAGHVLEHALHGLNQEGADRDELGLLDGAEPVEIGDEERQVGFAAQRPRAAA
jgi:hypothetical protein